MALVQPKKRNRNICSYLLQRAHNGPCPRKDLRVLRRLLEKQTSRFVQVWRKDSKHPIGYESGHLFFDHFKTCYSVWGTREKPVRLAYKHPPGRPADKIESALVFESPIDQESFQKCCPGDQGFNGHRSCLIGVTSDGWLVRRCLYTGRLLERVFISRSIRFKRVLWETDLERVVVKSVHLRSRSQNMASTIRPEHLAPSPVLYLALFQVAPLTFVAIIPIERAIFGHGVVDATLSMGLLSVMHQSGKMRYYGLDSILSENTFSPTNPSSGQVNSFSKHHIGGYPHGPVNVAFKAHPQVLFECSSYQHAISFGGYPWHFIACPQMQHNVFHVMSVEDKELVKGGVLQSDAPSLELDQAYFHGDRSGRLLHVGPHSVSCLKLLPDGQGFKIEPSFLLNFNHPTVNLQDSQRVRFTSSGRMIKQRLHEAYSNPEQESVQDIDYEDELGILVVLFSSAGGNDISGQICLYENETGTKIREIKISDWDEDGDHAVMMERDTILHLTKCLKARKFMCSIYRLML